MAGSPQQPRLAGRQSQNLLCCRTAAVPFLIGACRNFSAFSEPVLPFCMLLQPPQLCSWFGARTGQARSRAGIGVHLTLASVTPVPSFRIVRRQQSSARCTHSGRRMPSPLRSGRRSWTARWTSATSCPRGCAFDHAAHHHNCAEDVLYQNIIVSISLCNVCIYMLCLYLDVPILSLQHIIFLSACAEQVPDSGFTSKMLEASCCTANLPACFCQ